MGISEVAGWEHIRTRVEPRYTDLFPPIHLFSLFVDADLADRQVLARIYWKHFFSCFPRFGSVVVSSK